jgi:hypothetical protein
VLEFVENKIFAAARPKDQEGGQGYDVKLADAVKPPCLSWRRVSHSSRSSKPGCG